MHDHSAPATHVAGTTPYAWPWNGDLDPKGTAVLVVEPLGAGPALSGGARGEAVERAVIVIAEAIHSVGGAVIHLVTAPPPHIPAAAGQLELRFESDHTVTTAGIDGFYGSSLDALLRKQGIERLVLVGTGLETCVHSTMRSANDRGYECLLVVDACLPYQEALVGPSVSMIEMSGGIFGAVGTTAALVEALTGVEGVNQR